MSKLNRKDIKIFGNTAPVADLRQFGSTREGTPVISTDPDVLQALSNYGKAWNKGIVASLNIPPLEEFNTLQYLLSRELAYIQQVGIPEFSLTTTYFANKSIVRTPEDSQLYKSAVDDNLGNDIVGVAAYNAGTTYAEDDLAADTNGDIYRSLSDGNIGNALSNPTFWELTWIFLGDLENLKNLTQATETQEGIAKLITQANANLNVNDTDILTILKLVNRTASTTRKSIVELLTNGEMAVGTDTTRAATAANILSLFNTSLRSADGHIKIPINVGGTFVEMIIQWGDDAFNIAHTASKVVTLPIAFPNSHLQTIIGYISNSSTVVAQLMRTASTLSNFTFQYSTYTGGSFAGTLRYIAIGF